MEENTILGRSSYWGYVIEIYNVTNNMEKMDGDCLLSFLVPE